MKRIKHCCLQHTLNLYPGDLIEACCENESIWSVTYVNETLVDTCIKVHTPVYLIFIKNTYGWTHDNTIYNVSQFLFGNKIIHIFEDDSIAIKKIYRKIQ